MYNSRNIDPDLEKLRNEVEAPPNLDTLVLNLQRAASKIHAAYLFENIGKATLQKLCLLLSATATGKMYSGWQEFAAHLELTTEQIRCIDYDFKGLQDPTYYVLLAYVQSPVATLDKILIVLQKIERLDIINQIKDYINDLVSNLSQKKNTDEDTIIKPDSLPRVPLVLSPLAELSNQSKQEDKCSECIRVDKQASKITKYTEKSYGSIVMLTFAEDGQEAAEYIAKVFRSKKPKIGVLMLQEQEKYVYSRAEEFIDDCFKQVNYIVPILTKKYIEKLNNNATNPYKFETHLDAKYVKYIYSLLRYEFVKNQCCNNRTRCIVSDKDVQMVINSDLHPVLQAWFRESDIDAFVDNILLQKF
ncbi:uncharacterized protein [Prorops nasuta]|uniref:uncharacterized protein n=1 Tax=Prorops nasuta TaxID=863751 RepID=UPI0034CF9116